MAINIPGLDNIKERLGFASQSQSGDDYVYDDYDEPSDNGDYGEYAYDDNADYAQTGYGVSTRSRATTPALVTSRDIRDFSQAKQMATLEQANGGEDVTTRESGVYPAQNGIRSQGLQGLFSSTAPSSTSRVSVGRSNDKMRSTESRIQQSAGTASRHISVISPLTYEDAQRIARALRSGDVVVLSLRNTPDATARRLLDFAFGAAAAFDARVEYLANRIFAIAAGNGVSEVERAKLRDQGVL